MKAEQSNLLIYEYSIMSLGIILLLKVVIGFNLI